ncbi:hypothetical protein SGPA1_40821 [Streptomyces misionensis JCM 4497]
MRVPCTYDEGISHAIAHRAGHPRLFRELLQGGGQAAGDTPGPRRTAVGRSGLPRLAGSGRARPQLSGDRAGGPARGHRAALPGVPARLPAPQHVLGVPDHAPRRRRVADDRAQGGHGRPRGQLGGPVHVYGSGLFPVRPRQEGPRVRYAVRGEPDAGGADRTHGRQPGRLRRQALRLGPLVWIRPGSRGLARTSAALSSVANAPR